MRIPLIDPKPEKYKVDRIKDGEPNVIDKAVEIEDEDTGEKKIKFKSDDAIVPKPSADKISTTEQTSLWKKLQGKRYIKTLKFIDHGDETGEWAEVNFDKKDVRSSGESRMFETHRSLRMQKISDMFSEEDNTKVWLAAYLTILAFITLGGTWLLTQNVESTVAQAVQQGIEAGLQSTDSVQQGATGGG